MPIDNEWILSNDSKKKNNKIWKIVGFIGLFILLLSIITIVCAIKFGYSNNDKEITNNKNNVKITQDNDTTVAQVDENSHQSLLLESKIQELLFKDNNKSIEWMEKQVPGSLIKKLKAYNNNNNLNNTSSFTYQLNPDNNDETIKSRFNLSSDGVLTGTVVFDYNDINIYNISVLITDNGPPKITGESFISVYIKKSNLMEVNKKNPDFLLVTNEYSIDEDSPPGLIADLIITGNNNKDTCNNFNFTIDTSKKLGKQASNLFNITKNCQLNSIVGFQWKEKRQYQVPIVITNVKSLQSSEAILNININQNRTKFQFTKSRYFVNIYNGKEVSVLQVVEIVVPRSNNPVEFKILSGNRDDNFNFVDGTLMYHQLDNNNNNKNYNLKIQAENEEFKDVAFVDVYIMENGKNGLVFDQPEEMNITIDESSLISYLKHGNNNNCLARVEAHSRDNLITKQPVTYAGGDDDGYFNIDSQGCLKPTTRLRSPINEYLPNNKSQWIVVAKAIVYDDETSLRQGNATINIQPTIVNNNSK